MNTISFSKKIGTHGLIIALLSGTILSAPGAAQEALPNGRQGGIRQRVNLDQ